MPPASGSVRQRPTLSPGCACEHELAGTLPVSGDDAEELQGNEVSYNLKNST